MTLITSRERVRRRLGLEPGSTVDDVIDSYLNEGYRDLLSRTRCNVQEATLNLTAGVSKYTIDPLLALITARGSGDTTYLEPVGLNQMLDFQQVDSTGTDGARFFTIQGDNLLLLYPAPGTGDTLTFYYVPLPDELTDDTDEFELVATEHRHVIEDYALWKMADSDDDSTSGQGKVYEADYEKGVFLVTKAKNSKKGVRRPRMRVRGRRRVPHSNSQDV